MTRVVSNLKNMYASTQTVTNELNSITKLHYLYTDSLEVS
jgi:hypothetical protein